MQSTAYILGLLFAVCSKGIMRAHVFKDFRPLTNNFKIT